PSAAAIPPSAMTVCALPRRDLQMTPVESPPIAHCTAARSPAPPAPTTSTSCSTRWRSFSSSAMSGTPRVVVVHDAHRDEPHVDRGPCHPDHRDPGEEHVALVEPSDEAPALVAGSHPRIVVGEVAGEAVLATADEMAERVAAEGPRAEHDRVDEEDHRSDADAELAVAEERHDPVVREDRDECDADVERVAVQVLEDEQHALTFV